MEKPRPSAPRLPISLTYVGKVRGSNRLMADLPRLILPLVVMLVLTRPTAAEEMSVYGAYAGSLSPTPGAFIPAGTQWPCQSLDGNGRCWDGQAWHLLYPSGPRHYKDAHGQQVACRIIGKVTHDCWDGSAWYRLPSGKLFGMIGAVLSPNPGAFLIVPLPPDDGR